jgi:hypothetical protein
MTARTGDVAIKEFVSCPPKNSHWRSCAVVDEDVAGAGDDQLADA